MNDALLGSHASLERLFRRAGAPGDPPNLAHHSKWKEWLLRANSDTAVDPLQVLGGVLEELMEEEPQGEDCRSQLIERKEKVERALKKYGLVYRTGGVIGHTSSDLPGKSLAVSLGERNFEPLRIEFERTISNVETDPASALTASCSLLEALLRAYLEFHQVVLPSRLTIKPLWGLVQEHLGLHPKDQKDGDVKQILSGMSSIIDGIAAFRTHSGSAHGGGTLRYRVSPRHARLAVNAAHTMAAFIIETWDSKNTA